MSTYGRSARLGPGAFQNKRGERKRTRTHAGSECGFIGRSVLTQRVAGIGLFTPPSWQSPKLRIDLHRELSDFLQVWGKHGLEYRHVLCEVQIIFHHTPFPIKVL